MPSPTIENVRDYNRRMTVRWHEACRVWHPSRGPMPSLPMYVFQNRLNENCKRGFVVSWPLSARFFVTKRDALAFAKTI